MAQDSKAAYEALLGSALGEAAARQIAEGTSKNLQAVGVWPWHSSCCQPSTLARACAKSLAYG